VSAPKFVPAFAALAILWAAVAGSAGASTTTSHNAVDGRTLFASGVPRGQLPATAQDGASLYAVHCATCHGAQLQNSSDAPALRHAGAAAVDFYLTTGRMPLAGVPTQAFHSAPHFDRQQIAAIEGYVRLHSDGSGPIPDVRMRPGGLQRGRMLFEANCEACHGAAAQGATVGYGWAAPPLDRATPTQIGEAIRIGPGMMPAFTPRQLSDADIGALAEYVRTLAENPQNYGGTVMGYLGPTAEGAVGAVVGVGFLFWVVYFTGTKANGRRVHFWD
jgi:ubiquinol-cytochrome c reductase cytochrome c subunit